MPAVADYFSKGLCGTYGADIPQQYAEDLRNVRIKNGVTLPRAGYRSVSAQSGAACKALASNNGNLYSVQGGHLWSVNVTTGVQTDLGAVGGSTVASVEVYGQYTVIFTDAQPYSYDGTTLAAVTTYVSGSNPRFGKSFLNFMWAAGGNTGASSKRNILYISRPATAIAPNLCYDWTGSGSDAMVMKADIVGLAATLDRLFVFQEGRIDWLGKSSYVTIGGVTTFYPSSLSMGDTLASKDAAIVAGDKVIFLTSQLRVKTIGYALGVDQPEIGSLSEDPQVGIQKWMDENLHADQSGCYGWYDDQRKLAKFHVRSKSSPYNDLVLSWDLSNATFVVDDNKFFGSSARHLGNFYCGSCVDGEVYQDEYGEDDDGLDISGYRNGCKMSLGEQGTYKVWSGTKTSGTIRSGTTVQQTTVADGNAVDFCDISYDAPTLTGSSVGSFSVGEAPIAGPLSAPNVKAFLKERGAGYVNAIAKRMGVNVTFTGSGMFFSLDALATKEKATKYVELSEMAPIVPSTPTPPGALVDVDNNFITVIF